MKHGWELSEENKIKVGEYILETLKCNGDFPDNEVDGKKILEDLGVKLNPKLKGVMFHQSEIDGTMHIAVPPRDPVIDNYDNPQYYEIPQTYKDLALGNSKLTPKEIYQFRIGDYTISHCG